MDALGGTAREGSALGSALGDHDGATLGDHDGATLGAADGCWLGVTLGARLGLSLGAGDANARAGEGTAEEAGVGAWDGRGVVGCAVGRDICGAGDGAKLTNAASYKHRDLRRYRMSSGSTTRRPGKSSSVVRVNASSVSPWNSQPLGVTQNFMLRAGAPPADTARSSTLSTYVYTRCLCSVYVCTAVNVQVRGKRVRASVPV